jgi:ADP-ribose pyrophosphatase YjhB (NUDIX family)
VGVGGVIEWKDSFLLIKRKFNPDAGKWAIPGGHLELGEICSDGALRECIEETGLNLKVGEEIGVIDKIQKDNLGKIEYHYVLIDYFMALFYEYSDHNPSHPIAQNDALEVQFDKKSALTHFALTDSVRELFHHLGYL